MATNAIDVPAVAIGTSEVTVVAAPAAAKERDIAVVRFVNITVADRALNVYKYSGAGPGSDSNLVSPKNYVLQAASFLELGPFYLATGVKISAKTDAATGVTSSAEVLEKDVV